MRLCRIVGAGGNDEFQKVVFTRYGFTYIELITVTVLLSLLAIAAYPLISSGRGLKLNAAIKVVKADIQFTQRRAMSDGAASSITFTGGRSAYTYGIAGGGVAPYSRDLAEFDPALSIGSTITVTFNSLGEPTPMTEDTSITVTRQGESLSLIITSHTGKVTGAGF